MTGHNLDERPVAADVLTKSREGLVARLRSRAAVRFGVIASILVGLLAGGAGAANAAPPSTDLTDGAGDTFFDTITGYFTGNVIPAVLGLFALVVGVAVLMKWGKKAAKA